MNALDRMKNIINDKPVDRIPVFCNLFDQGSKELGMSPKEFFSKGEYVAEAQLRLREKYGYDNLWSFFYVGKEAELLGTKKIIFANNGSPNVGEMIIKTYEDISKLEVPKDVLSHPAFEEHVKCLSILRREAGGKYPICAYITSAMVFPAMLMGIEKWMELIFCGPKSVRDELLSKCSELFRLQIKAYRKLGVDILLYSNPFMSTDFVPIKFIKETAIDWMEKDLSQGGVEGVVFYCGGARVNPTIQIVKDKFNIFSYYLSPLDNIKEGMDIIGGSGFGAGVFNDILLVDATRDEIRREVKRIIDSGKEYKKFFFGTFAMPVSIPEDNIRAMIEAAKEFGRF